MSKVFWTFLLLSISVFLMITGYRSGHYGWGMVGLVLYSLCFGAYIIGALKRKSMGEIVSLIFLPVWGMIILSFKGNKVQALEPLEIEKTMEAAENGDSFAQYNLGVSYEEGEDVEQNFSEAVRWYEKSAEKGNPFAQYNLALLYVKGKGCEKNDRKAFILFKTIIEDVPVFTSAWLGLGFMYYDGQGTEANYQEAVKCFEIAARQGNRQAIEILVGIKNSQNH